MTLCHTISELITLSSNQFQTANRLKPVVAEYHVILSSNWESCTEPLGHHRAVHCPTPRGGQPLQTDEEWGMRRRRMDYYERVSDTSTRDAKDDRLRLWRDVTRPRLPGSLPWQRRSGTRSRSARARAPLLHHSTLATAVQRDARVWYTLVADSEKLCLLEDVNNVVSEFIHLGCFLKMKTTTYAISEDNSLIENSHPKQK